MKKKPKGKVKPSKCQHKRAMPDFVDWKLECPDCGQVKWLEEAEGNRIFNHIFGFDKMDDWREP